MNSIQILKFVFKTNNMCKYCYCYYNVQVFCLCDLKPHVWLVLGDPHSGGGGSTDPYKTLFVARVVSYFMDH